MRLPKEKPSEKKTAKCPLGCGDYKNLTSHLRRVHPGYDNTKQTTMFGEIVEAGS